MDIAREIENFFKEIKARWKLTTSALASAGVDSLTGLRNDEWKKFHSSSISSSLKVYIDLNGLKAINDSKGHSAGDLYLQRFSGELKKFSRQYNFIPIRLHGDEFLLTSNNPEIGWQEALEDFRQGDFPFAYGSAYSINKADSLMEKDKETWYKRHQLDRRQDQRRHFGKASIEKMYKGVLEEVKVS